MLGKIILFLFCFMGITSLIIGAVPAEFYANQTESWNPEYNHADEAVVDYFTSKNITVYDNQFNDSISYPGMNEYQFGLPSGEKLQVVWENSPLIGVTRKEFSFRHKTGTWLWWDVVHYLSFKKASYPSMIGYSVLTKDEVIDAFDTALNGSFWVSQCDHIITNVLIMTANLSWSLSQSWDNGQLRYLTSYQMNMTSIGVNVWSLITQLLTFQSPNFGISGWLGSLINGIIALPLWGGILYALYKLIAGLIPLVSGGSGD